MYTDDNWYMTNAGEVYDTDMDDKMGLARSPAKPAIQEAGLDIQATQAGVRPPPSSLPACLLAPCQPR